MDLFQARARDLAGGLEAELSVALDVMFPIHVFARAVKDFEATFPFTPLRVYVEALGAVIPPVTDGRAAFAVVGPVPLVPLDFTQERLLSMPLVMTHSPDRPPQKPAPPLPRAPLARHLTPALPPITSH